MSKIESETTRKCWNFFLSWWTCESIRCREARAEREKKKQSW